MVKPDGSVCGRYANQLGYLTARHIIRCLFVGNGWGKTYTAAMDVNEQLQGRHTWQPSPKAPSLGVWVCPDFKQFRILAQEMIEPRVWDKGWVWNDTKATYRWPNGSTLYIVSTERDWTFLQGIQPRFVHFDEEPPLQLWREMRQRRRAGSNTRFSFSMTATQGMSWVEEELYTPWLKHHQDAGLPVAPGNDDAAMEAQLHPSIWCWPRGGVGDNPAGTEADVKWYAEGRWSSEEEKRVRNSGGFMRLAGNGVFDAAAIEWMRAQVAAAPKVSVGSLRAAKDAA
jgi:hypothetical protein